MTQEVFQDKSSDARPDTNRIWDAIERLTSLVNEDMITSTELKIRLGNVCDKLDAMIEHGTTRCADRLARISRLEDNIEMIDKGDHPACVAQYRGIKLWVYASVGGAIMSAITTVVTALSFLN